MAFTRGFYLSLLSGHSVRKSFDIAREALRSSPYVVDSNFEGEKFILLPDKGSHDVPLFKCPQIPRWPGVGHLSKECSNSNIDTGLVPSPPPDFEGREVDMYRVISTLKERRLVSVVGDAGFGKSAIVAAVCRYVMDRCMFSDGVLFVRLAGLTTHRQCLLAVINALSRGPKKASDSLSKASTLMEGSVNELEESIVAPLSQLDGKLLVVLDHADELLATSDAAADLKYFLQKLFSSCDCLKVLVSYCSSDTTLRRIDSMDVVEHAVTLGESVHSVPYTLVLV